MPVYENLKKLNISLPVPSHPLAKYVPVKQSGNLFYVSGQLPTKDGSLIYMGKIGRENTLEQGQEAAQLCAINTLSWLNKYISLENVKSIIKMQVFVNCDENFTQIPLVANGASQLFLDVYGKAGEHARSAIGVYQLPLGAAVEIDVIVEI